MQYHWTLWGKRGEKAVKEGEEYEDEDESKGRISTLIHGKRKKRAFAFSLMCGGPFCLKLTLSSSCISYAWEQ